jgi:protein-tyrosine-phosphatase
MKKLMIASLVLLTVTALLSFKTVNPVKPKLYPALEQYFKSLSTQTDTTHKITLHDCTNFLLGANSADKAYSILFICPDNSFRSQEAEIILKALYSVNKYNGLNIYSCGSNPSTVDPRLIKLLTKVGFVVKQNSNKDNSRIIYEIKFSDNFPAIILTAKNYQDLEIPQSMTMSINLCSPDEANCTKVGNANFIRTLNYANTNAIVNDQQLENEFNSIASEISYVVNQMKSDL